MKASLTFLVSLSALGLSYAAQAADAKGASASASASADASASAPKPSSADAATLSHARQFSLRIDAGVPYNMEFRYPGSPRCRKYDPTKLPADQQKFCGDTGAATIGVAVGFAPVGSVEPYVFGRFGLGDTAEQTNMGSQVLVGAGLRLYTMSDSAFKIFFAPWLGLDFTSGPVDPNAPGETAMQLNSGSYKTDILVGLQVGPQYDITKYVGIYATGGLSFGMLRYFSGIADFNVGLQARLP